MVGGGSWAPSRDCSRSGSHGDGDPVPASTSGFVLLQNALRIASGDLRGEHRVAIRAEVCALQVLAGLQIRVFLLGLFLRGLGGLAFVLGGLVGWRAVGGAD